MPDSCLLLLDLTMELAVSSSFHPLVSIVIPVYNGSNYLREAIDSALAQTYDNIEIIVVNDGSTDEGATEAIALSYGDKIRYFAKENGGVATALNLGIEKMQGEYFSWLSHDDMYLPEKVEKQVHALVQFKDVGAVVFSDYCYIDENSTVTQNIKLNCNAAKSMKSYLSTDTAAGLHGCSLLISRRILEKYGKFERERLCTQDYALWLKIVEQHPFIHVKEVLVKSRRHPEQGSRTMPERCLQEADLLHSETIDTLKFEEMSALSTTGDLSYYLDSCRAYCYANYGRTFTSLFGKILNFMQDENDIGKYYKLFQELILHTSVQDPSGIHQLCLKDRKDKPRLLFFSNVWWGGGIEHVLTFIMKHLSKQYDIFLVTFDWPIEGRLRRCKDVHHLYIGSGDRYPERLAMLCALMHIDIFVGNPNHDAQFLSIYKLLQKYDIKSIAYNHGSYFFPFYHYGLYPLLTCRDAAYAEADATIWITQLAASIYSTKNANGCYIPNPNRMHNDVPVAQDRNGKKLLAVGRFYDDIKRIDRLLRAFKRVATVHPDVKLFLVGGYYLDKTLAAEENKTVKQLLEELDFSAGQIVLVGEVESVSYFYQMCDIFISTSEMEGFQLTLNEAGAYALPTVMFDIFGLEDIIIEGQNGFIVPQGDLQRMADAVCQLLENDSLRQNMGNQAKQLIERFSSDVVLKKWDCLVENLLNSPAGEFTVPQELTLQRQPIEFLPRIVSAYEFYANRLMATKQRTVEISQIPAEVIESKSVVEKVVHAIKVHGVKWTLKKIYKKLLGGEC